MRLWTIQTDMAYRSLISNGQLIADPSRCDADFAQPYKWMLGQMKRRLRSSRITPDAALWAWSRWDPPNRDRPDLRARGHLASGQAGFRIEFNVHVGDVLLSDFNLWHYVLNYSYLPTSERDANRFDSKHDPHRFNWDRLPPPHLHDLIVQSWDRIFDFDWCDDYVTGSQLERPVQATLWRIDQSMILNARPFVGR